MSTGMDRDPRRRDGAQEFSRDTVCELSPRFALRRCQPKPPCPTWHLRTVLLPAVRWKVAAPVQQHLPALEKARLSQQGTAHIPGAACFRQRTERPTYLMSRSVDR